MSSFMEAYLTQRGKRDRFTDTEFFDACSRLSVMVGARNITVLLAKLYAEQLIAVKDGTTTGAPVAIQGFLLAVLDCCLAKGAEAKVPDFVSQELSKGAGASIASRQTQLAQTP